MNSNHNGIRTTVKRRALTLGLDETAEKVLEAMRDLRARGVDILTVGQYLRPSPKHLPIVRYATPVEFEELRRAGYEMGFTHVESGPLVRSSYHASQAVKQAANPSLPSAHRTP